MLWDILKYVLCSRLIPHKIILSERSYLLFYFVKMLNILQILHGV